MEETIETSIFADEVNLHHASPGQRLANYVIDVLTFYAFIFCFFYALATVLPEFARSILVYVDNGIVSLIMYGIYMGLIEVIFQGRSLGKLITGTKAVTEDGVTVNAGKAFLRGLIRAVPFNGFSGLGHYCNPWHDRWTHTHVIDIKKSVLPL